MTGTVGELVLKRYGWTSGTNIERTNDSTPADRTTINCIRLVIQRDKGVIHRRPKQISRMKSETPYLRDYGQTKQQPTFMGTHVSDGSTDCNNKHLDLMEAVLSWWRDPVTGTANMRPVTVEFGASTGTDWETYTASILTYEWDHIAAEVETIPFSLVLLKGTMRA